MISIKTEKRFTTSDGRKHDSLREAQISELETLFRPSGTVTVLSEQEALTAATLCVQHAEKVVDVLTTKESSLPRARVLHGGRKVRTKRHIAPQAELPAVVAAVNGDGHVTSA